MKSTKILILLTSVFAIVLLSSQVHAQQYPIPYFGANSPGKEKETNWVPAPAGNFSLYLRCYWSELAVLDGTWMPPQAGKVK